MRPRLLTCLWLILLCCYKSFGQTYTLSDFKLNGNATSLAINGPSGPVDYLVTVRRAAGSVNEGTIKIFAGSSTAASTNTNAISSAINTDPNRWTTSGSFQYQTLRSSFSASTSNLTAPNNYAYAVALDINNSALVLGSSSGIAVTFAPPPSGGGSSNPYFSVQDAKLDPYPDRSQSKYLYAEYGTPLTIKIIGAGLQYVTKVTIDGRSVAIQSATTSQIVTVPITVQGDYSYTADLNVIGQGYYVNIPVRMVVPLSAFTPCAPSEICATQQCVTMGGTVGLIRGRILARSSYDFDEYIYNRRYSSPLSGDNTTFAKQEEDESVQWQASTDGSNWYDISGANDRNYQPGPLSQTTYFRRDSDHKEGSLGSRAHWYTSNVVAINVIPPAPVFTSSTYSSCGNGSVIRVGVNPVQGAVSYNWWVPYQGWAMSTDGQNFTNFGGGSYIVPTNQIYIRVPAGASGAYNIAASTNGTNGWTPYGPGLCDHSSDANATINVTPGSGAVGQPTGLMATRNRTGCETYYTVTMPVVAGATSYQATLGGYTAAGYVSGSTVYFPHTYYPDCSSAYSVFGTVTATGPCNSVTVNAGVSINMLKGCSTCPSGYREASNAKNATMQSSVEQPGQPGIYPNPASTELHINLGGQEAVAHLYNSVGDIVQEATIHEGVADTILNVQALPQGLYHLRVIQRDGKTENHQIKIAR
ncbi:T9SS type A sorting domain-containing protein [Hymenobacter setariae]|uniref:T9SS type A sorting domain-containing protein n=1 Tax=Hymenobacter setariae TaxID=2594794 RepID=A0A558BVS7_9BACT|nr:T9SS type A sorting domain-containing protein [Hymenobacter setariae]TVT40630.1 T9SS type A sorting domain-containing protein [Hymenobacter setariae]